MKSTFFCVLYLGSCILSFAQSTGYVRLDGKQFKDENGNDFYPMVMNYSADIIHDAIGAYYISPSGAYGNDWGYGGDCSPITSCNYDAIFRDLSEIYNMGFNTVRLMGPVPRKDDQMPNGFKYISDQYPLPYSNLQVTLNVVSDYATNANMDLLLDKLEEIVQIATTCSLKVILVPANGLLAQSPLAAGDYNHYLLAYASRFATNPAILAYDLYNEPTWSDQTNPPQSFYDHTKSEVCGYVSGWYHSIKDVADPNHLVTMGLNVTDDLFEWDPGVMTLDFASEHIYPSLRQEEGYDLAPAMERYQDKLLWMNSNIPMPWIVGETGFAATDNDFAPFDEVIHGASPSFNSYPYNTVPYKWGSTLDQQAFAQQVIPMIRNCGASGMAWWQFQDVLWYVPWSNPPPNEGDLKENFFGLLNPGDWNSVDGYAPIRKAAVAEFQALNHAAPALGNLPTASNRYYNPYNFPTSSPNTISGMVKNFYSGEGIKDAFVKLVSKVYYDHFHPSFYNPYEHYTFTDENGIFTGYPATDDQFPSDIFDFKISAPGCERIERGWTQSGYNTPSPVNCDPTTYTNPTVPHDGEVFCLKTTNWNYDAEVENQIVDYNRNQQGWNTLSISNVTVLSSVVSEFKAREEIHISGDFHAETGSDVHIYTLETLPDCPDFSSYLRIANPTSNGNSYEEPKENIEILFREANLDFGFFLLPNPTEGHFILELLGLIGAPNLSLKVCSPIGEIIFIKQINALKTDFDFTTWAKGVYYFQIIAQNISINKKLILQ